MVASILPTRKKNWVQVHIRTHRNRSDFYTDVRGGDPRDWQIKCVDQKCNNGWMREIENRVLKIFERMKLEERTRLTIADQRTLANWVGIKAIVSEYAPYAKPIAHHLTRKRLWKKHTLPKDTWRIWIGNYPGRQADALWFNFPMLVLPKKHLINRKSNSATYHNTQAVTYVVGELFIHLIRKPRPR